MSVWTVCLGINVLLLSIGMRSRGENYIVSDVVHVPMLYHTQAATTKHGINAGKLVAEHSMLCHDLL